VELAVIKVYWPQELPEFTEFTDALKLNDVVAG
jgi:hypothetical protein